MKKIILSISLIASFLICVEPTTAKTNHLLSTKSEELVAKSKKNSPKKEVSFAVQFAESEMQRFPKAWQLDYGKRLFFGYAQGVGCSAMLQLWKTTGDKRYFNYVKEYADSLIDKNGDILLYDVPSYNLDYVESGKVLFEIYRKTGDKKYKLAMDKLIDQLKNQPHTSEGGFWHKKVYENQIWLDGIYMASPFIAQYGKTFNQPQWIDEAIKQITLCHKHTHDSITGLYYHAWDESKSQRWANPQTGLSPNFWGRSIGWYFMAVVDALDFIPQNHPRRAELISIVQGLADALPRYQRDGLWSQVIDQPERAGNFPEASVTTQCMYAYAKAVNKGYINKRYRIYAEKAFVGIKNKLLLINSDGTLTLTRCCAVGGLGGNPYRDGSFEYYIGEKMRDNDAKATGPFIMGCIEMKK
jgi:unsaturated rhamnogalacturonyl hydrolase